MPFAQFTATGNGSTKQFTIPFPYVKKDHIVVALNNVTVTGFTFINDTTIEFDTISSATSTQETSGAPKNGVGIEITRDTPLTNALVDFVDGSTLTAGDLDTAVLQLLYGIQEAKDEAALGIQNTPQGQDAQNKPIINVADPTNAQDAVTKAFLERIGSITSTQIADGTIVNADVNASAAIDGTKISPDFGSQNIATSGTVDGRDVSADGTKLDGIESGATADQTNAEIKTAYEANANTNSFTDALLAKLNGIEANATTDQTIAEIKALIAGSPLDASHLAANSVDSSELVDGSVDHSHLSNDCVDGDNIQDDSINSEHYVDGSIDEQHLANNSVSNSKIADAELKTLATMQSGTASKLADTTALTSDIADLNQLDGMQKATSITDDDTKFPTSGAIVDYVAAQLAPIGGLEAIANESSFPNTQPQSGVVISIADAGGMAVASDGTASGQTVGGTTVNISGIATNFRGSSVAAGVRFLVVSTGSGQNYTYHKATLKEDDLVQLSGDINDFGERYRVGSSFPTTNNDSGDLFWHTTLGKLYVYNGTSSAFEETQSIGNFFISTLSPAFDGSTTNFTLSNAPTNAQQVLLIIEGVIQKPNAGTSAPTEGFALDGATVKLAAAPPTGASYHVVVMGTTVNIGTPSDNSVTNAILQNNSISSNKLQDESVTLSKLEHGTSSNDGKFLRANNGADPSYETVDLSAYLPLTGGVVSGVLSAFGGILLGAYDEITFDSDNSNTYEIKIKGPLNLTKNSTFTLPEDGNAGEFLKTDGSGGLSFAQASSPEIYGFNTNAAGNLIVTTTNGGVDNISGTVYDAFEDVIYAATGFTFSINANGKLIATI